MIKHPLPPRILQTPLHQLPYLVSQLNSSIHKVNYDMIKYLEENITVCMDNHNQKLQLRKQILAQDEQYKQLENIGRLLQIKNPEPVIHIQPPNYEDKLLAAIKNQNYEEMIKLFQLITDQQELIRFAKIAANLLATPTKGQKEKNKQLLSIFANHPLIPAQVKDEIIEISVKVLIQKCFKMYFQQNVWNTNRNQVTYYSDIIQLYQKSFNCAFKQLQVFNLPNYHQAHVANTIFQKFNTNVLYHLVTKYTKDKSIQVVINFKEVQQNNLFHHLTNLYCTNTIKPLLMKELQLKTVLIILRNNLVKNDSQLNTILQSKDVNQLVEWSKSNKQINYNKNLFNFLFGSELQLEQCI